MPDATLREARTTTKRVARTFSLACRLLPRHLRDDVYRLYLVFRTLDDLVDDGHPHAHARVGAVEAWCDGDPGRRTREVAMLDALARRYALPRDALRDFCAGMRFDLAAGTCTGEDDLDRYC